MDKKWFMDSFCKTFGCDRIEKEFKEENTMGPMNTKDVLYATYKANEDPAEIEYEQKRKDLINEAEKKILDIRKELATALQKLDQECKDAERLEIERKRAKVWKQKYDKIGRAHF